MAKPDIRDRTDIRLVLDVFYDKLLNDPVMKSFFLELDLEPHMEVLCDFWENALFQAGKYRGDMMQTHLTINRKRTMTEDHFTTWLHHFNTSVDTLHQGEIADLAMNKARTIATIMKAKIDRMEQNRLEINN